MKFTAVFALLLAAAAASRTGFAQDLRTRAEATNYEETSRYADVIAFIEQLQQRTPYLRVEWFGKTEEGRDLPLMILADPPLSTPAEARASGKPVFFVMANIHAGEVEGKEASLALARRIATGDLHRLLDKLVILIAPIYNADGNEKIDLKNRTAQNGPIGGVGVRTNSKGLDLNRDYIKAEGSETRALLGVFNTWDPAITMDLHTTDGSYHGYHLTYSSTLTPNADPRLLAYQRDKMLPAISKAVLSRHHYRMYWYGNFSGRAPKPGEKETRVWRAFDHHPRVGQNYAGIRNRLTFLSEAYSYLDFKGRIGVTSAFVEESMNYMAAHAAEVSKLLHQIDQDTVKRGLSADPGKFAVEFENRPLPKPVDILMGTVEKQKNPRSGRDMTVMVEKNTPVRMQDYGLFVGTRFVPVPRAYLLKPDERLQPVVNLLLMHGVTVERLAEPLKAGVDSFVVTGITRAPRPFQGHAEVTLKGRTQKETVEFPVGSILVRTAQPLATVAEYLLEPESDDGAVTWNLLDSFLDKGKPCPIYKLFEDAKPAATIVGQPAK
jgi:hypothetical protein